jgi:hypothetical protein
MAVLRDLIVDGLVHHISRRFSSKEDWMKSTVISSFRNWPQESQQILQYENNRINIYATTTKYRNAIKYAIKLNGQNPHYKYNVPL